MIIVAEANNGVDAVREINKFKPDLVFMDIQMPGMTGFEVLTRLEELPQIIFLLLMISTLYRHLKYMPSITF